MLVSDRLLTVIQQHVKIFFPELGLAKLRDSPASRDAGEPQLVIDADEPVEHEGMHGVFIINVELSIQMHARDLGPVARRELLGDLMNILVNDEDLRAFANDPDEVRGIGDYGLHIFDIVILDGGWDQVDDELMGRVIMDVTCMGVDKI